MRDLKDDGGPAYPVRSDQCPEFNGMTLRDYFAGQAIGEIIAFCTNDTRLENKSAQDAFARKAYEIADSMIEARK